MASLVVKKLSNEALSRVLWHDFDIAWSCGLSNRFRGTCDLILEANVLE